MVHHQQDNRHALANSVSVIREAVRPRQVDERFQAGNPPRRQLDHGKRWYP
jgi:hypothetical protein